MDKGWSWVTMLAAFGVHFSCGGLQYTAGFIRFILLQNADENETRYITWITSIYSGMISFIGPIASVLVHKYGCRTSVIVGGSLEIIGFLICFFVRNIWIYFISYSFLAGIGSGLTYTAVMVLINFNFDRYLSLASGIAISGEGMGLIFMSIIINFLYEKYGLQPTFLLIGGITLHKWVLGALMRPSSVELDQLSKFRNSGKKVSDQKNAKNLPKENEFVGEKPLETEKENGDGQDVFCPSIIYDVGAMKQESDNEEKNKQVSPIFMSEFEVKAETSAGSINIVSGQDNMAYNFDEIENIARERHDVENTASIGREKENNTPRLTVDEIKTSDCSNITDEDLSLKDCSSKNKMSDLSVEISHDDETKVGISVKMAASVDEAENQTQAESSDGTKQNSYLRVFKTRKFIFFLFGILFYSVPEEIIYMMYPDYVVTNGSSQYEMSNLLSIIGIFSTISRFFMGITANSKMVDIYVLFSAPFGILGVVTLLLPSYVHTFTGRVFYAIIFGLYNSAVYSLLNEIVLKITGIDDLTAAFGFVMMLKGTIGVFAAPLADAIESYAHNSDAGFVFAGFMYTTCLVMLVLLP